MDTLPLIDALTQFLQAQPKNQPAMMSLVSATLQAAFT